MLKTDWKLMKKGQCSCSREFLAHSMRLLLTAGALNAALMIRCAQQMAPSGGQNDTTPPAILATTPQPLSVKNPLKTPIEFHFSEWIDPQSAQKSISMFPALPQGYAVEAYARKLRVVPKQPLEDSTTYHITINTSLRDLRGNAIAAPVQFIFSTGAVLDSGSIFGCVRIKGDNARVQPKIALFAQSESSAADSLLLSFPTYLVQTDSGGFFSFEHIRPGPYRIIGFTDENNDDKLWPGKEKAFSAMQPVITVEDALGPIELYACSSDTAAAAIISLRATSSRRIHGEWSDGPRPESPQAPQLRIEAVKSEIPAPQIQEHYALSDQKFVLLLQDSLAAESYTLIYPTLTRLGAGTGDSSLVWDTVRFNGVLWSDTIRPELSKAAHLRNSPLSPSMRFVWSEPVRASRLHWTLEDSLGDTVAFTLDSSYTDTFEITLARTLLPGRFYTAAIPLENFSDFAGNTPADTTDTATAALSVSTLHADSLCYLLKGGAPCLEPDANRIWQIGRAHV
jgi:hypothetical protein